MEENINILGNIIKDARIAMRLSVPDLSDLSGFSISAIYNIENGKTIPKLFTLKILCDVLFINYIECLEKCSYLNYVSSENILGITIELARILKGYSQRDLSDLSGISPANIHKIEKGKTQPQLITIIKICNVLCVDYITVLEKCDYHGYVSNKNILGIKIEIARINKGFSQQNLSDLSGVCLSSISKIEAGNSIPQPSTLRKICAPLSLDFQELSKLSTK